MQLMQRAYSRDGSIVPWAYLWLILLLGAVLQDPGELYVVEHAALDGRLAVHLVNILVSKPKV